MRSTLLLIVAAAVPLLSSCQTNRDTVGAGGSDHQPAGEYAAYGGGGDYHPGAKAAGARPFTGPSLPSAPFNVAKGRFGFGGTYSTSKPGSLESTYDPENFLRYWDRCWHHCHYGYGYGYGCGPSYCYRPSYGYRSWGCRY